MNELSLKDKKKEIELPGVSILFLRRYYLKGREVDSYTFLPLTIHSHYCLCPKM